MYLCLVSPQLAESLKEIRMTHSSLLSEFQHLINDFVEEKKQLTEQLEHKNSTIKQLIYDKQNLSELVEKLDEVKFLPSKY